MSDTEQAASDDGLENVFGRRRGKIAVSVEQRDFKSAPRPSPAMRRELEALSTRIAHAAQRSIGNYLRTAIAGEATAPEVLEYSEALKSFVDKDWSLPLTTDGGDRAVIRMDEALMNVLLTRVLGGGPLPAPEGQVEGAEDDIFEYETALAIEIGPISRAGLRPLIRTLLREWNALLRDGTTPFWIDSARESLPAAKQLRFDDTVAVFDLAVRLGNDSGRIQFVVQAASLTKVVSAAQQSEKRIEQVPAQRMKLESVVKNFDVKLAVVLGRATVNLKDYLRLQPGDVMILDRKVGEPLSVRAGEQDSFTAQPGRIGQKLAVRIVERLDQEHGS